MDKSITTYQVSEIDNSSIEGMSNFDVRGTDLLNTNVKNNVDNILVNSDKVSKVEELSIESINIPWVVYNFSWRRTRIENLLEILNEANLDYLKKQEFYYSLPWDKSIYESLLFLEIANKDDFNKIATPIVENWKKLKSLNSFSLSLILDWYIRVWLMQKFFNLLYYSKQNDIELLDIIINKNKDVFDNYNLDYSSEESILKWLEKKFKNDYEVAKDIIRLMWSQKITRKIGKLYFDYLTLNDFKNISRQQNISNQTELNLNLILEQFLIRTGYYKKAYVLYNYLKNTGVEIFEDIEKKYKSESVEEKVIKWWYKKDLDFEVEVKSNSKKTLELTHKVSSIQWLELRFHLQQIPWEYEDLINKSKTLPDNEWLKFYKSQNVKSIILKILYLERLKKENYDPKEFTRFLLDFKSFKKFEFLYLILEKELSFGDVQKAIRTLTHIHKMWGVSKEPVWLQKKYSSFFELIKWKNLSDINDFNNLLKYFFDSWEGKIANDIYKNIPSKAWENRSDYLILRDANTEKIFYSSIDDKKVVREFWNIWYTNSDRWVYNNTFLVISERFIKMWKLDYALKSISKLISEWWVLSEEFIADNTEFVKKYCSLKLDFSDNVKLIEGLNRWLQNEKHYNNVLDVINSMTVLTIDIQHWILPYLKDEDLLLIFNRTLWAKAIKWGWEELWLYALDFLKRFISIGDKSRCTSSRNSAVSLWIKIPKEVDEAYNEMIRIWDTRNTKFLREFYIFEKLFRDWKYEEAKQRHNSSDLGRTLGTWYYTIYIENLNDEDFVKEKIKWLNLHLKWEKFLNICLNKAFKLDITKIDQSLFFNTYIFIEDILKKIDEKGCRLTSENLELYKDYIYKKNNNLLPVLKKDKSKASASKKIMLDQNITFSKEEIKFIDNISKHNWWDEYGIIIRYDKKHYLQNKSVILQYLLKTNYNKWIEYFSWTWKSNELIYVFASLANESDIIDKFESILIFLCKNKNELKLDVNETYNDNQFWNIRKDYVYRIIKSKLSDNNISYLNSLREWLEELWFKDLDKDFESSVLYTINWYDFKQKHLDDIISISKLPNDTKFNRTSLYWTYNFLTYLSNVHIRWEKKWANWLLFADALIQVSNILYNSWEITKEELLRLNNFFNRLKTDQSKWVWTRKEWLTLFEEANKLYDDEIDNLVNNSEYNSLEVSWKIIKLSRKWIFLNYLFLNYYDKAIAYFGWNVKTNQSILLFSLYAKAKDIEHYTDNIKKFFSKQRYDVQYKPYSKNSYSGYTNIKSDFLYNAMNSNLDGNFDEFLWEVKVILENKWFKGLEKRNVKNIVINTKDLVDKFISWDFWEIDKLLD